MPRNFIPYSSTFIPSHLCAMQFYLIFRVDMRERTKEESGFKQPIFELNIGCHETSDNRGFHYSGLWLLTPLELELDTIVDKCIQS
ncbi:hypothetical protein TNIN_241431 [Trichonephila inaurata madagascariensis]|uniref:Uncharacterized protein n=1 Tax=Trichonephila inaurata madagascariensis TaxID=2747483 RepID=A0A8X6X938_9ARAC|nr:hypothetical protein TNIN_241431 [Trichonephila inaurata madagascariensis]